MRLQMRRIDHQPRWFTGLARQFGEYLVEHPETGSSARTGCKIVLCGPYSPGASRQRSPFLMTKTIPLITRRSSTLAIPCDNGKYRSIRCVRAFDAQQKANPSHGHASLRVTDESANHPNPQELIGPEPRSNGEAA